MASDINTRPQRVGSGTTKPTSQKLSELAQRERRRAETNPETSTVYHDIRCDLLCAASKRENHFIYEKPIPAAVAHRLRLVDNLTLEKIGDSTKISWPRG